MHVGEKQREIIGDGFVDPLIAVARPSDNVSPPLVSNFVKWHELAEMFLAAAGEAGTALYIRGQKRVGGNVKEPGPALPESSGNLGDAEITKGKRAAVGFVKADGSVDVFAELFESNDGVGGKG